MKTPSLFFSLLLRMARAFSRWRVERLEARLAVHRRYLRDLDSVYGRDKPKR